MAKIALYQKYRSADFDEVVGQEYIVRSIQNAVRENKIGHAYLFCGPRGTGKTTMARILAKAVNCENPEKAPCGECSNCIAAINGVHPDIIEINAANETIAQQERVIKNFQEMSKDIKFEPVTDHSKYYDSHIIKLKETKENYTKLRNAYETYLASIQEGSEEMQQWEAAWQQKLDNTKFLYGEDSEQYKKMLYEKEQADKTYVVARQKTQEQLEELTDKENKLEKDYWDGLADRMNEIYNIFNNNVMQPIQDGLGALFDFQLEELQEALDEIEDMLDQSLHIFIPA